MPGHDVGHASNVPGPLPEPKHVENVLRLGLALLDFGHG